MLCVYYFLWPYKTAHFVDKATESYLLNFSGSYVEVASSQLARTTLGRSLKAPNPALFPTQTLAPSFHWSLDEQPKRQTAARRDKNKQASVQSTQQEPACTFLNRTCSCAREGLYVGGASISGPAQQQCVSSSDERRGLGARGKPRRAVLG